MGQRTAPSQAKICTYILSTKYYLLNVVTQWQDYLHSWGYIKDIQGVNNFTFMTDIAGGNIQLQ